MRVVGSGKLRAVVDDRGVVNGLWVADTDFLSSASKETLQATLGHIEAISGLTISIEKYQRFIERQFTVKRNDPQSGGGFFLMISDSSGIHAGSAQSARSSNGNQTAPKRPWWKFWS